MLLKIFRIFFSIVGIIFFLGIGYVNPTIAEAGEKNTVVVKITGIKPEKGQVQIAVYDSAERWLEEPVYSAILNVKGQEVEWRIDDIPYGNYAIAVFHDENTNGKADRNLLGIPTEAYGFSNNVKVIFSPPKWDEVKFTITDSAKEIEIKL
jgi:uncharacterized protein (DUF2141 family)